jgi:hypothetical protein
LISGVHNYLRDVHSELINLNCFHVTESFRKVCNQLVNKFSIFLKQEMYYLIVFVVVVIVYSLCVVCSLLFL